MQWLVLFGVGAVAGFMNVLAGGGSTITMPLLIFLGLDSAMANGTNRVALFVQNLFAIRSFHGEEKYHLPTVLKYSAWTLPGAILGALFAISINDLLFRKILAIVIIGVMMTVLLPQSKKSIETGSQKNSWLIYPALLGIGFYGGFIQAGVGFFIMAAFAHILHMNLIKVNMIKVFIVFIYTIPALLIFIVSKNVDYILALALASGNAFGAWWGAKLTVRKGEKVIRFVLFVVVLFMAVKLFNVI
ncbi:sulfite exporter TauE/SafE family protein [candidate division KSB1 bacterium]|nr:sulfite exporter TauE/SafE family protein [candidate division KSB1 bacterium]RQW05763.1 MAG: sulfite exporter TauE/SafE family protein [candidate division KSB1 bacterium]